MTRGVTLEMRGNRELEHALRQLPAKTAVNLMRSAARAALVPARKAARQNLSAFRMRSGLLHRPQALKLSTRVDRSSKSVVATLRNSKNTFYGMFLEFGTRHIPGARWMTRAVESTKTQALDAYKRQLWRRIDREAKNLARMGRRGR